MLIMKLTQPPLPPNMLDYTCELDVDIPAEPVVPEKKKPSILPEYREMYEKNHDMAGWLKIEGTNVDYPHIYASKFDPKKPIDYGEVYDKNKYYLTHDFDKEYSFFGEALQRMCAHIGSDYRSPNILLYGHNMSKRDFFP